MTGSYNLHSVGQTTLLATDKYFSVATLLLILILDACMKTNTNCVCGGVKWNHRKDLVFVQELGFWGAMRAEHFLVNNMFFVSLY